MTSEERLAQLEADAKATYDDLQAEPLDDQFMYDLIGEEATPVQMAEMFLRLRALYETADEIKKTYSKFFDWFRVQYIPDRMDELGASSIKVPGIGRLGLTDDLRVKTLDKDKMYEWLEQQGLGDLITETVNASSLKATLRRKLQGGEEIPDDLFSLSPFTRAAVTKS